MALVSDTGMRLAKATGLSLNDFTLQADIPFVEVRKHPWRSLKTSANAGVIPLSGMALWAAQRILQQTETSSYVFPRYDRGSRTSSNSASAAINKWLHCEHSLAERIHQSDTNLIVDYGFIIGRSINSSEF